jgi:DNA (cytosine-5)-methyltransferase 1
MWFHMARIVREVRPRFAFVENSPILTSRGLGRVLGDLAEMGYNARWGVLGADDIGGPHQRERIWILAYSDEVRCEALSRSENRIAWKTGYDPWGALESSGTRCGRIRRIPDPAVCSVANGVAVGMDELESIGNGQVPAVAATAFRILSERLM